MLARKWSLVSCSAACGVVEDVLVPQRGQDRRPRRACRSRSPCPCRACASSSSKVRILLDRTRWKISWRVNGKCAQRLLSTLTPRDSSSCSTTDLSSAAQPPQPVLALVAVFTSPSARQPASMASTHGALGDVVAGADRAPVAAAPPARARRAARHRGQDQRLGCRRQRDAVEEVLQQRVVVRAVAHQHGAEQPLAVGAHDDALVDRGLLVAELVREAPSARPCASPMRATSTPSSLSLVLMSAPWNTCLSLAELAARRPPPCDSPARPGRRCGCRSGALADREDVGVDWCGSGRR